MCACEEGLSMRVGSMVAGKNRGWIHSAILSQLFPAIACVVFLPLFLPRIAPAETEGYILYLPASVAVGDATLRDDGVLVRKIRIRPGDTLSRLSRHFSGKAHYYPQILLFNKIANPNLIYAGKELLVPVPSRSSPTAPGRISAEGRARAAGRVATTPARTALHGDAQDKAASERMLFEKAVSLYSRGKYREAIERFSRFLKEYPESPLASDASLYRAECFLRLSEH
jgi:tetratricopeptide (TPR) repeat protein